MELRGSDNAAMATGDFNNDGKLDLALGTQGGLGIIHGDGTGHFGPAEVVAGTGNEPWALAVGDFNRDNRPDLATVNQASTGINVFLGDGVGAGAGGFSLFDSEARYTGGAITAGDFNNDGNLDFLVTGGDASMFIYLGDGSGNFSNVSWIPFTFGVDGPFEIAVADFNGDGKADITTPFGTVHFGDGAGAFAQGLSYQGTPSRNVKAVDINDDGKLDLVTAGEGNVSVLLGDGKGDFGSLSDFQVGETSWIAIADFNGDGKPDVATLNRSDATVSVLLNSTYQTPVGTNSIVLVNNTTFTFDNVTAGGSTSVTPVDPASVGQVPGGFAVSNSVAYEIATTATFTGSVTLGFKVPGPISEADFNTLAILHNVNGTLVDVTATTPARIYATLTIYATTTTFSPFYLARKGPHVKTLFDQSRAYKGGSTIPIKLQILNATNGNMSSSSTALIARDLRCLSSNTTAPVVDSGNANPDYTFRYDATLGGAGGGYIFNLNTKGLASGQYILSFYLGSDRSFFYTVKVEVK